MILQVLKATALKRSIPASGRRQSFLRGAITAGELDIYPEYTGNGVLLKMKRSSMEKCKARLLRKVKNWMRSRISWSESWDACAGGPTLDHRGTPDMLKNKPPRFADLSRYSERGRHL